MNIVYIEWVDAVAISGWDDMDRDDLGLDTIKSVGFLVKETEHYLALAAAVGDDQCNAIINIPKAWIKKRQAVQLEQKEG